MVEDHVVKLPPVVCRKVLARFAVEGQRGAEYLRACRGAGDIIGCLSRWLASDAGQDEPGLACDSQRQLTDLDAKTRPQRSGEACGHGVALPRLPSEDHGHWGAGEGGEGGYDQCQGAAAGEQAAAAAQRGVGQARSEWGHSEIGLHPCSSDTPLGLACSPVHLAAPVALAPRLLRCQTPASGGHPSG